MAQASAVNILEDSFVSPPPGSVLSSSQPLTFFDIQWLSCCPMQRLLFYEYPHSTLYFKETTLQALKHSLSLTLQYFFPFAANLVFPPSPHKPCIRYNEGDSIRFSVVECAADFKNLVGNHARGIGDLQSLVPKLSSPDSATEQSDLMAIQVSLFPNTGISIGFTFLHVVADGNAFIHFVKSWARVHRSGGALTCLTDSLPYHNRNVIKDPSDIAFTFLKSWSWWEEFNSSYGDGVRVTYIITRDQIEKLKETIKTDISVEIEPLHISAFVVSFAHIWICLMKLQKKVEGGDDDTICHFIFPADCRTRLGYSIPDTYFGNCVALCYVEAKRNELLGKNGLVTAARAIGRKIMDLDEDPLRGAENWLSKADKVMRSGHHVTVAGSPKFRVYDTDFGWGTPIKNELAHIYSYGFVSIAECRDHNGAVELGLALDRDKLDAFSSIFHQGLILQ